MSFQAKSENKLILGLVGFAQISWSVKLQQEWNMEWQKMQWLLHSNSEMQITRPLPGSMTSCRLEAGKYHQFWWQCLRFCLQHSKTCQRILMPYRISKSRGPQAYIMVLLPPIIAPPLSTLETCLEALTAERSTRSVLIWFQLCNAPFYRPETIT